MFKSRQFMCFHNWHLMQTSFSPPLPLSSFPSFHTLVLVLINVAFQKKKSSKQGQCDWDWEDKGSRGRAYRMGWKRWAGVVFEEKQFGFGSKHAREPLKGLFLKKLIYLFIYLFLAALGLCCCTWAFSSCSEWGLLFVAVCGLLIAVASLVVEHRL